MYNPDLAYHECQKELDKLEKERDDLLEALNLCEWWFKGYEEADNLDSNRAEILRKIRTVVDDVKTQR